MEQDHSPSEIVRAWWHPGLGDELPEFDDATTPPPHHAMVSRDEGESDGLGMNVDLELKSVECASVMPLEILYRSVRNSSQSASNRRIDKTEPRRQRPLSAPALLPSTMLDPLTSSLPPPRGSSEYSFADNITDIIETMLDHALTTESPARKGLSGKPLQVEDALVAVTRGEYSTDTVQEDYLPNRLKIPLRLQLKAITEEQEDSSPIHKKQQSITAEETGIFSAEETEAFMAELEDTSRVNNRESGSSTQSSDPMGMFNYNYLEPSEWYNSQPLVIRSKKNAGTVSVASSLPISPHRAPIIHSLISPFPPPNKPLPALPLGVSSQIKRRGTGMASTVTVSSSAPLQLLQTKLYHESLKSESKSCEKIRPKPLFSSEHSVLEPDLVCDQNLKQEAQGIPEAHIHPLFRTSAQSSRENSLSSLATKHKPLAASVSSGSKSRRGLSDVSDRSMPSPSLPPSKPPSSYLCSPPLSPRALSVTESDPFTSPNNELSQSPLRLSSVSADSALQARLTANKSASLGRGTSLKEQISLEKATSIGTRASLGRSASFATRASRNSDVSTDKDDSCSDLISFNKSERSAPLKKRISMKKETSVMTRPSIGKRASFTKPTPVDSYGSFAENIAPSRRPSLGRLISLDSTTSGGSSIRKSAPVKTTGADAPFILHEFRPQKRLSIDCIKEYAQAVDEIHGLQRVKPLNAINDNFVNIPKEQFCTLPTGLTSPSVSELSHGDAPVKSWPLKKKPSNLRRVSDAAPPAHAERESYSTMSSGATHSDTVARSASLSVATIDELDSLDHDNSFEEPAVYEPSPRKRSGRMAELLALRVEEDKQAAALRQLKEQREREGKMAKLLRRAQSFEKVGEGFKKFFSAAKKDDAKMAEAGYQ
ncbi:hypothetical protein MMC32_002135 [Xylographa parallela]|nr:hypothetical protein [Xylographa parallela]